MSLQKGDRAEMPASPELGIELRSKQMIGLMAKPLSVSLKIN